LDATAYHQLRLEGFTRHPREFRVAPEDEQAVQPEAVAGRLESSFVAGACQGEELVGISPGRSSWRTATWTSC
jgi:hypothetical protein